MTRALITGILGSGGSYMAEHLVDEGYKVHGIARWHTSPGHRPSIKGAKIHECDLNDFGSVLRVLEQVHPDVIFHLASSANVRASFDTPAAILANNVNGTVNLLEAARKAAPGVRILLCSSSEVYGQVAPGEGPIDEDRPTNPVSPYAVSKLAQDALGYAYFKSYGMNIVRTRMFTYINPRRADLFATSFAMQIAAIEAGHQGELLHGNLESVRTVLDVRDATRAYRLAAEMCTAGVVYNIGGTMTLSVGSFLDALKHMAKRPVASREDPGLLRPADVTCQIPDTRKFLMATHWAPRHSFEDTVAHLLEHCRAQVRRQAA